MLWGLGQVIVAAAESDRMLKMAFDGWQLDLNEELWGVAGGRPFVNSGGDTAELRLTKREREWKG